MSEHQHTKDRQIQDDRIELLENIDLTKFDDFMTLIDYGYRYTLFRDIQPNYFIDRLSS